MVQDSGSTNGDTRDAHGRFAPGNPGGPGRPRRSVEADYLRTLSDAVPPERWAAIVEAAVSEAEAGDAAARAWLARYLLPEPPAKGEVPALVRLAAAEMNGGDAGDDEVRRHAENRRACDEIQRLLFATDVGGD